MRWPSAPHFPLHVLGHILISGAPNSCRRRDAQSCSVTSYSSLILNQVREYIRGRFRLRAPQPCTACSFSLGNNVHYYYYYIFFGSSQSSLITYELGFIITVNKDQFLRLTENSRLYFLICCFATPRTNEPDMFASLTFVFRT